MSMTNQLLAEGTMGPAASDRGGWRLEGRVTATASIDELRQ